MLPTLFDYLGDTSFLLWAGLVSLIILALTACIYRLVHLSTVEVPLEPNLRRKCVQLNDSTKSSKSRIKVSTSGRQIKKRTSPSNPRESVEPVALTLSACVAHESVPATSSVTTDIHHGEHTKQRTVKPALVSSAVSSKVNSGPESSPLIEAPKGIESSSVTDQTFSLAESVVHTTEEKIDEPTTCMLSEKYNQTFQALHSQITLPEKMPAHECILQDKTAQSVDATDTEWRVPKRKKKRTAKPIQKPTASSEVDVHEQSTPEKPQVIVHQTTDFPAAPVPSEVEAVAVSQQESVVAEIENVVAKVESSIAESSVAMNPPTMQPQETINKASKSRRKRSTRVQQSSEKALKDEQLCTSTPDPTPEPVEQQAISPTNSSFSITGDSDFEMLELSNIDSCPSVPSTTPEVIETLDSVEEPPVPPLSSLEHFPCLPGAESQFVCEPQVNPIVQEGIRHPDAGQLIADARDDRINSSRRIKRSKARKAD